MDKEAWHAVIHEVEKTQTCLSDWTELNWTECICCIDIAEFSTPWPLMPNLYTCLGFQLPEAFWLFWGTSPPLLPSSRTIFDVNLNMLPVDSNSIGSGMLQAVRSRRGESHRLWSSEPHSFMPSFSSFYPHISSSSLFCVFRTFSIRELSDPRY